MKYLFPFIGFLFSFFVFISPVAAHVTVNPREAVVGRQIYTVHVPNEKNAATVSVRVIIPEGLDIGSIAPVPGWRHTEKRAEAAAVTPAADEEDNHEESSGRITEITWTGGQIGVGEFLEFPVSTNYTGDPTTLVWKAYQTYADGEVVPWDDTNEENPAPKVTVIKQSKLDEFIARNESKNQTDQAPWLSIGAFILSVAALAVSMRKH